MMRTRHKLIKNSKGFTLIEIIVTLAILSIILTAINGLFSFNLRAYSKNEKLSQVQFDVRMASDFIIKEVRNTPDVSLTDNTLSNKLDLAAIQSKFPSVHNVDFEIKSQGPNYFLEITLDGADTGSENDYSISSEVILNNITNTFIGTAETLYFD